MKNIKMKIINKTMAICAIIMPAGIGSLISAGNTWASGSVSALVSQCNDAGNVCSGISSGSKSLSGSGSVDTSASYSQGVNSVSSQASLTINSFENGLEFQETISGVLNANPDAHFKSEGRATGNSSFFVDVTKPTTVTVEIKESISLLANGPNSQSGSSLSVSTKGSDGRTITIFSDVAVCSPGLSSCGKALTQKVSLNVVPGQEIFVSSSTQGFVFRFDGTFQGSASYTVRIIKNMNLQKVSGDSPVQEGAINSTLPQPLVVKVTDETGAPVSGQAVNWTITGPSGATGQSVSPTTSTTGSGGQAQVSVRLGDKSETYTITATCPSCTSGSPVTFTTRAKGCQGLTLDLFSMLPDNTVWPTLPSDSHDDTAVVIPQVTNPAPPSGCLVNFDVEPVSSQGHPHGIHPKDKAGKITTSCTIPEGMITCDSAVQYTAPEISGEEKITATLKDTEEKVSKSIFIMVPDLGPLFSLQFYRLTGQTGDHPDNHYGTNDTIFNIQGMAQDYFDLCDEDICNETLGINDMSLIWGGLFDVDGNWNSATGHGLHRGGKSVDIDRCAQTLVRQDDLDTIVEERHNGDRIVESALKPPPCEGPADTPRIHYEFP